MAKSLCFSTLITLNTIDKPAFSGLINHHCAIRKANWINDSTRSSKIAAFEAVKASGNKPNTKPNSILCADCDGNGAKKCGQCEGKGVNLVDHFNGQFKAGASCWLCSGKKEILCGNCNGAGFIGGFMSTLED